MNGKKYISRRMLMAAGIFSGAAIAAKFAWSRFATPMEPAPSLSVEVPSTLLPTKLEPALEIIKPLESVPYEIKYKWEWRPIVRLDEYGRNTWPRRCDVSTYTPDVDGGSLTRTTGAINFGRGGLRENLKYPAEFRTLKHIHDHRISICAIPLWAKWIHEELREYHDGTAFHRYRVRFPWYDPVGHLRIPCDRVLYRDKWGNLVPQRDRFDMFMYMPGTQAFKHGVPLMPIEIYEQVRIKA